MSVKLWFLLFTIIFIIKLLRETTVQMQCCVGLLSFCVRSHQFLDVSSCYRKQKHLSESQAAQTHPTVPPYSPGKPQILSDFQNVPSHFVFWFVRSLVSSCPLSPVCTFSLYICMKYKYQCQLKNDKFWQMIKLYAEAAEP